MKNNQEYYTLYLEYLGGLIPLLSARKSSKLKPDFVIFDPFLTQSKKKKLSKSSYSAGKKVSMKATSQNNCNSYKTLTNNVSLNQNLLSREEGKHKHTFEFDFLAALSESLLKTKEIDRNLFVSLFFFFLNQRTFITEKLWDKLIFSVLS